MTTPSFDTDALWRFGKDATYLLGLLMLMFASMAFGWALKSLS
jgi:hypothetical protein